MKAFLVLLVDGVSLHALTIVEQNNTSRLFPLLNFTCTFHHILPVNHVINKTQKLSFPTFTFSINFFGRIIFFEPNENGLFNEHIEDQKQRIYRMFHPFYHWGTTPTFYLYYTVAYDSDAKHHHLTFIFSKPPTPKFNTMPFYNRQNSKVLTLLF